MIQGELRMGFKERQRLGLLVRKASGEISLGEAANIAGLSYRQMVRLWERYKREGDAGLVHRSRGRRSNRKKADATRSAAVRLYQELYDGFGPTLAAEKLAQVHNLKVDHETLRRWLLAAGLWCKRRKRLKHRQWRERKAHFGELVQMDGSIHKWFGSGSFGCLMSMVDDATGTVAVLLSEEETTEAALTLLRHWIETYGIPRAIYADRKNVYVSQREPTLAEELAGEMPLSAFGKVCQKLGIRIITAYSPQAKGRVERKHGLFQDRWCKELKLKGIADLDSANRSLPEFVAEMNRRFARPAAEALDFHQPFPPGLNLADIFTLDEERTLNNDWTVRYENRWFQITRQSSLPPAQSRITVRKRLDGSLAMLYRNRPITFVELDNRPLSPAKPPNLGGAAPNPPEFNALGTPG